MIRFPPQLDANLLNMDAPEHTRLRSAASTTFTRNRVAAMRPAVEREAQRLLAAIVPRDQAGCRTSTGLSPGGSVPNAGPGAPRRALRDGLCAVGVVVQRTDHALQDPERA